MPITGADFTENAKPLAQAAALIEVRRFRLHVALSDVHKLLTAGDHEAAKLRAEVALDRGTRPMSELDALLATCATVPRC